LEELQEFKEISTRLIALAKMELRGWEWTATPELLPMVMNNHIIPVLGLLWDLRTDEISLDMRSIEMIGGEETSVEISGASPLVSRGCRLEIGRECGKITKRGILSAAQRLFDPIGITCAVTLVPKLLIQELWKSNCSWDEEIPEEVTRRFFMWKSDLHKLKDLSISRWMKKNIGGKQTLHVFTDSSKFAYAACVFLRVEHDRETTVQLVMAKSRVAPTKKMTIPRLELLGCGVGARLATSVKKALEEPDMETVYWTDSSNALYWIEKHENWNTYVWNRVEEIRKLSSAESWRHIPGDCNPADLPSRGCSASKLLETRWEGPQWLREKEHLWPKSEVNYDMDQILLERKKTVISNLAQNKETPWYMRYFSSYRKTLRMTAWILRWKNGKKGVLSGQEERKAEIKLIKLVQDEVYYDGHPQLKELHARKDEDGLWRVQTKIVLREDEEDFRFPVLLPHDHQFTKMLIRMEHNKRSHCGNQVLQNVLRERFWIPKSRKLVREIIHSCGVCRRHTAKNVETVEAPLPVDRVREAAVFEVVGIDLAGPLILKNLEKVWFVVFTCGVFRAVHLELVANLTSDAFLQSLRRFVARRGRPHVIFSDNGTNFEGANNLLGKLDWKKIQEETGLWKIQWNFNPPSAPWWGGFWERIVGLVKTLLKRVLGNARLTYEELNTLLCDAEEVINSRPLTYISENVDDLLPLSPSLFLSEIKSHGVPDLDQIDTASMNKRMRYRQQLREDLRKRFRDEYLGLLVHHQIPRKNKTIAVDDIVLVGDDNQKRIRWKLGRVLEMATGRDGIERVAKVRVSTGELTRPVQRLFPLEMQNHDPVVREVDDLGGGSCEAVPGEVKTRSGRVVKKPARFAESISFFFGC